jgi:hypothetical protein
MGGLVQSGNRLHDAACLLAEIARQNAIIGVASSPSGQVVMDAAEVTYHRAILASCRTNNSSAGMEASLSALRDLGVNV